MDDSARVAAQLLETGVVVGFRQDEVEVLTGPDDAEFMVRVRLTLGVGEDGPGEEGEDEHPEEVAEWAGLGFLYALAVLSFHDARPQGSSALDYVAEDGLSVADFVEGLRYQRGRLRFSGDYIRGRRMKTDIELRPDGTVELETRGRGKAALRWLDRLQGKKLMTAVPGEPPPGRPASG
jgi:hypothetical protein